MIMPTQYNKLVRDYIPDIITASGKKCTVQTLSDDEYLEKLDAKLEEELNEYLESGSLEELADLLEVLYAVTEARGYTREELERVRAAKAADHGAFRKRILLKTVC